FLFTRSGGARARRGPATAFLLLWAGWCVLFFSISSSKLPPYILPALPALALLVGGYLRDILADVPVGATFRRVRNVAPRLAVATMGVVVVVLGVIAWRKQLLDEA